MDIKQIQELVKLINKTNIGEITIEEEGVKITVKQKKDPVQQIITGGQSGQVYSSAPPQQPQFATPPPPAAPAPIAEVPKTDNYLTIKSPMIGTFIFLPNHPHPLTPTTGSRFEDHRVSNMVVCKVLRLLNAFE